MQTRSSFTSCASRIATLPSATTSWSRSAVTTSDSFELERAGRPETASSTLNSADSSALCSRSEWARSCTSASAADSVRSSCNLCSAATRSDSFFSTASKASSNCRCKSAPVSDATASELRSRETS